MRDTEVVPGFSVPYQLGSTGACLRLVPANHSLRAFAPWRFNNTHAKHASAPQEPYLFSLQ